MSENKSEKNAAAEQTAGTIVKNRRCPSCGQVVAQLQLSAFPIPEETQNLGWLRLINKYVGWSVRTRAQAGIHELQFLAFTHNCATCSLISWWDLGVEELEFIVMNPNAVPQIGWTNNSDALKYAIDKLPEKFRMPLTSLLETLPALKSSEKKT